MSRTLALARGVMGRLDLIFLFTLGMLMILPAVSRAQQNPPIAEQIANAYGLGSFGQVDAIRYTWSLKAPGRTISHTWEWSPKTGTISYEGKDKDGKAVKASYQRSQLESQSDAVKKQIDPTFANDQYWLLLPFHIVWDGATVTDEGTQKLPLGDGSARRVVAKYPSEGGYQPGDAWDLYIGDDNRIKAIAYHRGANNPPKLVIATYAGYKKAGPILIATDHHGTVDGKPFEITLTGLSVKMTGSDKWIDAQ